MINSFLKLVEIRTKVASVLPFILGSVFSVFYYHQFSITNFLMMFISLFTFDMTATAINNYIDYRKARKKEGYNYEKHNAIVRDELQETTVVTIIIVLLSMAIISGVLLYMNTDIIVLILGIISFLAGIFYSFGPVPISRTPLGEIFSGFFMGFIIIFLATYIHIYDQGLIKIFFAGGVFKLSLITFDLIVLFFVSLPAVNSIANIMLANNICDIEDDWENRRFTLPIYIGRNKSLQLFKVLYYIIYVDIIVLVILDILPLMSLLILLTVIPVKNNISKFLVKQTKKDTFDLAVKNFIIINSVYLLTLVLAVTFLMLI